MRNLFLKDDYHPIKNKYTGRDNTKIKKTQDLVYPGPEYNLPAPPPPPPPPHT